MKNKHIDGHLILSKAAMKDTSCDSYAVQTAIENAKLEFIMNVDGKQWCYGKIPVKTMYRTLESADVESIMATDVMDVCEGLKEFLEVDAVSKLGLSGEIIMKTEDTKADKASMARIIVKEGQVSYQSTSYVWSESVTV